MNTLTINDIKKDLYRSKVNANFSHYCAGKLYYTVTLQDGGLYQFPINTVEDDIVYLDTYHKEVSDYSPETKGVQVIKLSSDLGNTAFDAEIKASTLLRWISKAYDKGDFICINKAPEAITVEEIFELPFTETNDEN